MLARRSLFGLGAALFAAPALVREGNAMPVSVPRRPPLAGVSMVAWWPEGRGGPEVFLCGPGGLLVPMAADPSRRGVYVPEKPVPLRGDREYQLVVKFGGISALAQTLRLKHP